MKLYFQYLSLLFKAQMQYRASFLMLTAGQFFFPFTVFAGMYLMFERFGGLKGWDFFEAALIFGIVNMAFSVSECFARGFDAFSRLVVSGEFDRLLLRPRGTIVQVLGSQFEFTRIGRMLQSAAVLIWAIANLPVEWNAVKIAALLLTIVGGVLIFVGIYMLMATICFWTIQGLEVAAILTDGGRELAQFPLNIYEKWVAVVCTFIIPFGCVSYLPVMYILDKADGPGFLYACMPLAGLLFLVPCVLVWHWGVRHYRSTGS
jgi:ABC-2 type transport system permease protein